MARERFPAFQFYPKDFLSDENQVAMSLAEAGAYIRLMSVCWNEGSLPADMRKLGKLCGATTGQMTRMWGALQPCFRPHSSELGRLVHPRLEKERAKLRAYSERMARNGTQKQGRTHADRDRTSQGNPCVTYDTPTTNIRNSANSESRGFLDACIADPVLQIADPSTNKPPLTRQDVFENTTNAEIRSEAGAVQATRRDRPVGVRGGSDAGRRDVEGSDQTAPEPAGMGVPVTGGLGPGDVGRGTRQSEDTRPAGGARSSSAPANTGSAATSRSTVARATERAVSAGSSRARDPPSGFELMRHTIGRLATKV